MDNITKELSKVLSKQKRVKKYTVKSTNMLKGIKVKGVTLEHFATLIEARRKGMQYYRSGRFVSLVNSKYTLLTL